MHNERNYIHTSVEKITSILREVSNDYEIIIVDDASTDGSGQIADELANINQHVKVAHHKNNRKLGGSLKTGFALASKELVLYSDIDMPFDFKEIKKAIDIMRAEKADFVCAYRLNKMADGLRRYIYSKVYNFLIRLMFGLRIKDVNFSFKLIRNSLLKELSLSSEGSFIDAEMLIKARRKSAKIAQFGTIYLPRTKGISRLSSPDVIFKILKEAFIFRLKLFYSNN
jgi:glycosyltransferase involved in cell wall biosynthesis